MRQLQVLLHEDIEEVEGTGREQRTLYFASSTNPLIGGNLI